MKLVVIYMQRIYINLIIKQLQLVINMFFLADHSARIETKY